VNLYGKFLPESCKGGWVAADPYRNAMFPNGFQHGLGQRFAGQLCLTSHFSQFQKPRGLGWATTSAPRGGFDQGRPASWRCKASCGLFFEPANPDQSLSRASGGRRNQMIASSRVHFLVGFLAGGRRCGSVAAPVMAAIKLGRRGWGRGWSPLGSAGKQVGRDITVGRPLEQRRGFSDNRLDTLSG